MSYSANSPPRAASTTDQLLNYSDERLRSVRLGSRLLVLSALDVLSIGKGMVIGGDFSNASGAHLYVEDLLVAGAIRLGGGGVSAHAISDAGDGVVDASGAIGTTPSIPHTDPDASAEDGGPGGKGGTLGFYLESVDPSAEGPPIRIDARGGAGGDGQEGKADTSGGNGGSGGAGGTVIALVCHPYLAWVEDLILLLEDPSAEGKRTGLSSLLERMPETPALASLRAAISDVLAGEPGIEALDACIRRSANQLSAIADTWRRALLGAIDASGGARGTYGQGRPPGKNGEVGEAGTTEAVVTGAVRLEHGDAHAALVTASFLPIHPTQCAMTLQKAELAYYTANPRTNPDALRSAAVLLRRLLQRTAPYAALKSDDPLAKELATRGEELGAPGTLERLREIHRASTTLLDQLSWGLDIYGRTANYVPLASLTFYRAQLDALIVSFSELETEYREYYAALAEQRAKTDQVKRIRNVLDLMIQTVVASIQPLRDAALDAVAIIDAYQVELPPLKAQLTSAIDALGHSIDMYIDFDLDSLLATLSIVAFAPTSEAMWAAQAAEFTHGMMSTVVTDDGAHIRTEYLVKELTVVEAELEALSDAYATLDDGTLQPDDPGAAKLLTIADDLRRMLDGIYDSFPEEISEVRDAFERYVEMILVRNNEILTYNAIVAILARKEATLASAQRALTKLNDAVLATYQADLPALSEFVSSSYYLARDQVTEMLSLTARAFRFWALSSDDLVAATFGTTPPAQLDSATLSRARDIILLRYAKAVETFGGNASHTPAKADGRGIRVTVPEHALEIFRQTGETYVNIPPARDFTTLEESPFYGMANVRVYVVRAFIHGAHSSDGVLSVTITHTGKEQIVAPNGDVFPFEHDLRRVLFKYRPCEPNNETDHDGPGSDLASGEDAPVASLDGHRFPPPENEILQDGNFGIRSKGATYALVGPFAAWHIALDERYNDTRLDLSGVRSIELEFHVTSYAFR